MNNRAEERPIVFSCGDKRLVGILHAPAEPSSTGVVIVVGGPQYRVGCHRQFVIMARDLAAAGIPVLRFDYRGMGDSEGPFQDFEKLDPDIDAAIGAFFAHQPGLSKVALWGLCNAGGGCLLYGHKDRRVAGMVLVNPDPRTEAGIAGTYLRYYYVRRLLQRGFWLSIWRGEYKVRESVGSFLAMVRDAVRPPKPTGPKPQVDSETFVSLAQFGLPDATLPDRLLDALRRFPGPVLFLLSGADITARAFADLAAGSRKWRRAMRSPRIARVALPEADHTFTARASLDEATRLTREWLARL